MITILSEQDLIDQCLAFFRVKFPSKDTTAESFLGKIARATAMCLLGLQKSVLAADNDSSPSPSTSTAALDSFAFLFGLDDGTGTGTYGRLVPIAAAGIQGYCTGTNGTVFNAGLSLTASDGTTKLTLSTTATISGSAPGTGQATGTFTATTTGTAGNLLVGDTMTWDSPPSGADSSVTVTVAGSGGTDSETNDHLLQRLYDRLQSPPKGGSAADYRVWAESVTGVPIARAYVYPLRHGLGSVDTLITQSGTGTDRDPGANAASAVLDAINDLRPVDAHAYVLRPSMEPVTIKVRLTPSKSAYDFDWDSGGTSASVSSYTAPTASTAAILTFASAVPQALIDAIDTYTASTGAASVTSQTHGPRIQVGIGSGAATSYVGPSAPVPVRCVGYIPSATVQSVFLQNDIPSTWTANPPVAGDVIYNSGPMQYAVATAIRDYIDSLGPARGAYAFANDSWEDKVAIARITQVALATEDSDGTRFASNLATLDGTTLAFRFTAPSRTYSEQDAQALDFGTPELLYADFIFVTD